LVVLFVIQILASGVGEDDEASPSPGDSQPTAAG
jgi:hypothetical protein